MSHTLESPPASATVDGSDLGGRTRGLLRGWVPALRIARRTAWRHRGRTVLIASLVAIPIVGLSTISVVTSTSELTATERADRLFGATDGVLEVAAAERIDPPDPQTYLPGSWRYSGAIVERDPATVDASTLLPEGTRVVPGPIGAPGTIDTGERLAYADVLGGALDGPLAPTRYRLSAGHAPQQAAEVVLADDLAERLELVIGDRVTVRIADGSAGGDGTSESAGSDELSATVVGLAVDADCVSCGVVYTTRDAASGLIGSAAAAYGGLVPDRPGDRMTALVELPGGVDTVAMWRDLADVGVSFLPRDAILNPDRYPAVQNYGSSLSVDTVAAFGLVVGFGLLEVVLLAGTAFAVGARRQVRELGLVAANGGERRDVRRIVLAQGVVLGLVGGVAGVVVGFLPLVLGWRLWERAAGHLFGSVVVHPLQLLGIVAFGAVAGVLAAVIPARTAAKIPVMAALSNRFVAPAKPLRRPLLGVVLIAVGGALSFGAAVRARTLQAAFDDRVAALGGNPFTTYDIPPPDIKLYVVAAVAGLALMAAGLLIGSPALVAALSRLGRFLPLVPRLAMRDAGRHRHRTAPAICAVAIAVGGSVALGVVFSADDAESRQTYTPSLPLGWATVYGYDDSGQDVDEAELAQRADVIARAADILGADSTIFVNYAAVVATAANSPAGSELSDDELSDGELSDAELSDEWAEPVMLGCDGPECPYVSGNGQVAVGDAGLVAALTGRAVDPAVTTALAAGAAVLLQDSAPIVDGQVRLATYTSLNDANGLSLEEGGGVAYDQLLPAGIALDAPFYWQLPTAVISPETAAAIGLVARPSSVLLSNDAVPTQDQMDRATGVLTGSLMDSQVELGYQSDLTLALVVLLGASALVTIASVAIAVGLAAAEGRADLATLAAVGADPRRRRVLAMCQAAVVGLVGCLLGVAFGVFVAAVGLQGFGIAPWFVPWALLGGIGLAVPLLAVVVAGLFTRSRLPLARRLAV